VDHAVATAVVIDSEIKRILEEAYADTRTTLSEHRAALHKVADALLEYETLTGEEVAAVLKGEDLAEWRRARGEPPPSRPNEARPTEAKPREEIRPEGARPAEGYAY
jgi:cell division protease FtsH